MINVILPCPECKGPAVICASGHEYWVACTVCYHDTAGHHMMEDAVLDWNRRM